MTVSEFTFLALGLVLGVASGVALVEIVRARPAARREVRLTVAQDAVPRRRPTTLADDAFVAAGPEPARGGPADRRDMDMTIPAGTAERRTHVQSDAVMTDPNRPASYTMIPIRPEPSSAFNIQPLDPAGSANARPSMIGAPIASEGDPGVRAMRPSRPAVTIASGPATRTAQARSATAVAVLDAGEAQPPDRAPAPAATERCMEERRLADERCELATHARARANEAAETLRAAQRRHDSHEAAAADASEQSDPRTVRAAKEAAQHMFRKASRSARDPHAAEAAARAWLLEINRINAWTRDALSGLARERASAEAIAATLDHLGLQADAARIGADTADAACTGARAALATCDEQQAIDPAAFLLPRVAVVPSEASPSEETLGMAIGAGAVPRIFRMLQGDQMAMTTLVGVLAAEEPEQAPHWQALLTALIDAIVTDALTASALEFPADHPFWGPLNLAQAREVVRALGSLGYRFDGRGGWVDERVPSQRDLSMAISFAGLDPIRVRHWPDEEAMQTLFSEVRLAADEHLASVAGDLTLGEMVTMLGRRADGLADLWNQWGTIRPILLQDT